MPVSATAVVQKDVPIYLDALGNVQAYSSVTVRTQIDGQIMKIAFTEGQEVKKGDVLAQIDPNPLQALLEQNQAHKKQDEAKVIQDHAKVRQDQAKVKQDQAKQVQDEASLANAKVTYQRYEDTLVANAVTKQSVDDARTLVATLTATIQGDQASTLADEAAIQADEASIQADEAMILADDANIKFAQTQLNYTTITSPLDGRVGIRAVDEGNVVHTSDVNGIVVVSQLQPISVIFTLPQQDLQKINARMAATKLPALAMDPNDTTLLDRGELQLVDNQIDPTTGNIKLKATFPNKDRKLWPGGFVNIRLLLETRVNSLVISAPAVQQGPDGYYVFLINDDTVQPQPVKVGLIQDGEALIDTGLKAGDSVVLSGQDRLKAGSKVKVQAPKDKDKDKEKTGRPEGGDATDKTDRPEKKDKKNHEKKENSDKPDTSAAPSGDAK